eukprot:EG_transcript_782
MTGLLFFSYQFNSTALIVATNDLAVECNEQLVDHTHNSLAEELDIAVTLLNYTIAHTERLAWLSEGERQLGALNLSTLSSNTSQQFMLRQHLWSYITSCNEIQHIRFSFGFLSVDGFFLGYWLDEALENNAFNYWATPPKNETVEFSTMAAVYKVDSNGSPLPPATQLVDLSSFPWFPDVPPNCTDGQCTVLQYPVDDGGTFVLFVAKEDASQTLSSVYTKLPTEKTPASTLGSWIVQIPLAEIGRMVTTQRQSSNNHSQYLLVLPDLTVLVSSEPDSEVCTMQAMVDANSTVIAAIGAELGRRGVLVGSQQQFSFYYQSPTGEVWGVQGEKVSPAWYLLLTPYRLQIHAYFDPSESFTKMKTKFCVIQFLTWATFTFVVCIATATYVTHTFYQPERCCRGLSHGLMLLAILALLALFVSLNVYLELFSSRNGPSMITEKCTAALVAAGMDQLRWEALQSANVIVLILRMAPLINAFISDAVRIGKLPLDTLDSEPAQRPRLLAYQWLYSALFPEVQAVFGGGWLVYSGCLSWPNGSMVWLNSTNPLTSDLGCFGMGPLATTTALYSPLNPVGLQPAGPAVWRLSNYWLYAQPWWAAALQVGPSITAATLNPVVDPNGDLALSYSRVVPTGSPDSSVFVTAVNVSFNLLQLQLLALAQNDSGTIYLMSKNTKQLIATSTGMDVLQNGHGLYADEWISAHPEIQASYGWLRDRGDLDRNGSVVFIHHEEDGPTFYCSMIPLATVLQSSIYGVDLVTVAVASFENMHAGVKKVSSEVEGEFSSLDLWQSLFIYSGSLALICFPLAYATLLGWINWHRWQRRKVPALVTKMLLELPPGENTPARLPPEPSAVSVVDFCLGLPQYRRCPPPSHRAVKHMLAQSFHRLRLTEAVRFIEACGLSPDEALAICLYTYELGDWSPMPRLFPGEASDFQLYTELNRALQTEDPDLLRYWQPLLHPLLAGLHKVQANPFASLQALAQPAVKLSWWASLQAWVAHLICGAPAPVSRNLRTRRASMTAPPQPVLFKAMVGPAAALQPGDVLHWPGLSSWTSSLAVAQAAKQAAGVAGLLFLESAAVCRIRALSHTPAEEEVVLLPGATLVVGVTGCDCFDLYTDHVRFVELRDGPPAISAALGGAAASSSLTHLPRTKGLWPQSDPGPPSHPKPLLSRPTSLQPANPRVKI